MKLEEAIKIIAEEAFGHTMTSNEEWFTAVKMAHGSLIHFQEGRKKGYNYFEHLLPGET